MPNKQMISLIAAITAEETAHASAVAMLNGLVAQIEAANIANNAPPSPAVASVIKTIKDSTPALADAVAAVPSSDEPATPDSGKDADAPAEESATDETSDTPDSDIDSTAVDPTPSPETTTEPGDAPAAA